MTWFLLALYFAASMVLVLFSLMAFLTGANGRPDIGWPLLVAGLVNAICCLWLCYSVWREA